MTALLKKLISIKLNLGIKKVLRKIVGNHYFNSPNTSPDHNDIKKIIFHYGADYRWSDEKSQNIDKKTNNLGYGLIHYCLVRNQKPKHVLCVGSMYGFIPFMLAKACEENQYGHVDFVDAGYDINNPNDKNQHIFGQGFWKKIDHTKHFSVALNPDYITTHICTIESFLTNHPKKMYDYIYLDGDHRYEGSKQALKFCYQRLNEEGYICLHDIHFAATAEGIKFGQWKVWQELCESSSFKIEFSNHYSGIGIVQKITKPRKLYKHNFDTDPEYIAQKAL